MNNDELGESPIDVCRELILQGLSIPQISRISGIKLGTVRWYVRQILDEEDVSSRLELLALEIDRLRKGARDD